MFKEMVLVLFIFLVVVLSLTALALGFLWAERGRRSKDRGRFGGSGGGS
jgi:hypothetical protein